DVVDELAVPDRLEDPVREAQREGGLGGVLSRGGGEGAELFLRERRTDLLVQLPRGGEVAAERLLHDHPRPALGRAPLADLADEHGDRVRRDGEVVDAVAGRAALLVEVVERRDHAVLAAFVREVGRDVAHPLGEPLPGLVAELVPAELLDGALQPFAELVVGLPGAGDAHDAELLRQQPPQRERVERREELAPGEVPGGAEDDQRARLRRALQPQPFEQRVLDRWLRGLGHCSGLFSRWPPKALRIAERTRLPQSASPREAKRSNSDAARTGAGTPVSTADCTVQRPSPEPLTRPAQSSRFGASCSACAVRSSSHDETTEPRRQSSATAATSRSYL